MLSLSRPTRVLLLIAVTGCGSGTAPGDRSPLMSTDGGMTLPDSGGGQTLTGGMGGQATGAAGAAGEGATPGAGGAAGSVATGGVAGGLGQVTDAGGSPHLCSDLFDQTIVSAYSFDISAEDWAKLDADFHDIKDVLAGTPPQTLYPVVFHYGSETVSNAAVRLRGKSSWVNTVMFDQNPKMQFDIKFDAYDTSQKFHGVGTLHFEMARDEWSFLSERVGNNWFRKIGLTAPCANSATITVNGSYYGLYVAEEGIVKPLLKQFFPGNSDGDLFKGGTEPHTNVSSPNWTKLQALDSATDIASLQGLVDLPNTVLEWAAEAVVENADGYYGGSHNYWLYDEGAAGYVWLLDHTDSALEWAEVFTPLGYKEHPIYWWAGRPLPDPPGKDYLIVMNDPAWRSQYVQAVGTQTAKWNAAEIGGWIDTWSRQIADFVAADPHKWATVDQFNSAVASMKDMAQKRPHYLQSFVACEGGDPSQATDGDGDGVPWCNDCDDSNASVSPGAPEICGNHIDDNCNGVVDENCPGEVPGYPGQPDAGAGGGSGTADAGNQTGSAGSGGQSGNSGAGGQAGSPDAGVPIGAADAGVRG